MPVLSAEKKEDRPSALEPLVQLAAVDEACVFRRVFPMGNQAGLLAAVRQAGPEEPVTVDLTTDAADRLVLHWGVSEVERRHDWIQPPESLLPEGSTNIVNGIAAETPFKNCQDDECDVTIGGTKVPLQRVRVTLPPSHGLISLQFVIRAEDSTRWWKDGNSNFVVRVPGSGTALVESMEEDFVDNPLGLEIIKAETSDMWTLMHRYNKSADLLEGLLDGQWGDKVDPASAAAHIYVWLRYSSNRHITWQRNYNTQPRILSAAQERLTQTIARAHAATTGETQEWVRLMIGMLGRGGDGQKIRDEILNIMHRNNIKEVKGTWMEEWHQKLHNNTTPDDVGICEAYLAFLRGNGDNGAYWRVLSDHGITRERLQSFERSIRTEPDDYPDQRGTLIGEFEHYLSILKAVHSGTDLMTSVQAASNSTPESAKGFLGYVVSNLRGQVVPLLEAAVEARTEIRRAALGDRELLYLDLALEGVIRGAAERAAGANPQSAIRLVAPLLQNLALTTGDNEEVVFCLAAWLALPESLRNGNYPGREEALQAAAVVDRIRICLANISDAVSARIEPISSGLGHAFGVEEWAIELFAEEVVRGGPAFAVSQVLGNIEAGLRSAAELSAWQVISPGGAVGRLRVEHDLYAIQDEVYEEPTVLLIDRVTGEEEIPEGAVAVLTPDAPDVLSHVSVRARNMGVLFATCHDDAPLKELRELKGRVIDVKTTAAGDVAWEEALEDALAGDDGADEEHDSPNKLKIDVPKWVGKYAVGMDAFETGVVGAKSKNIANLRGKLPSWIALPASVTIPFGSFETALEEPTCAEVRAELEAEVKRIPENPAESLRRCREIIMGMTVPEPLKAELSKEMSAAGMKWPEGVERWEEAFAAMKGVWASKFNERAYYSMRKAGLPFMDLRMAVLVMRVVPAQYAFVIHTVNPATRDEDEIYCELVKGLGETLVSGQFPGKGMSFAASKRDLDNPRVLAYPSKSAAMFVPDSLIFRSDSNGEDLEGYAGAGLYDSITMDPCVTERVDYTSDPLIADESFRRHILSQICKVGLAIEEALGSPQDVEGVVDPEGNITVVQTRPQV
uniref:Pyruvate phosphate dikinase AMP/ATP-binding domain-containing protein n=1 Tax=Tetraselmis chuii TaxID=63592 RepID=A0A7S1X676_9CHLO